jgi:hypothetical protein
MFSMDQPFEDESYNLIIQELSSIITSSPNFYLIAKAFNDDPPDGIKIITFQATTNLTKL